MQCAWGEGMAGLKRDTCASFPADGSESRTSVRAAYHALSLGRDRNGGLGISVGMHEIHVDRGAGVAFRDGSPLQITKSQIFS